MGPPIQWLRRGRSEQMPLVLLHGFTGANASWSGVVAHLRGESDAIAVSLPGHHPDVPVAEGFVANVDWLAGRLSHAGIGAAHVVGYSLGARTALGLAVAHPAAVAALSLVGLNPGLTSTRERHVRRAADRCWIRTLRERGLAAFVAAWEALPLWASQTHIDEAAQRRQRSIRLSHTTEGLASSLEHMGLAQMPDYRPAFRSLACPTRLIVGERDATFRAIAEDLQPSRPGTTLMVVAAAGHNVPLEAAAPLAEVLSDTPR